MVFSCSLLNHPISFLSMHIVMQIGLVTRITGVLPRVIAYSLDLIWFLGVPRSNLLLLDSALKLNIGAWLMLLLNWLGFNHFRVSIELGIGFPTPTLYCDDLSVVSLSHNLVLHSRTKHIELDIHFVREKVQSKALVVLLHTRLLIGFTKPVSSSRFCELRFKLKVLNDQKKTQGA